MYCTKCDNQFSVDRAMLGYKTCLTCGEHDAIEARLGWCIVPLPKQAYTLVTDKEVLKDLNQKQRQGFPNTTRRRPMSITYKGTGFRYGQEELRELEVTVEMYKGATVWNFDIGS